MPITTPSYLWLMNEVSGTRYATLGGNNIIITPKSGILDESVEGRVGIAYNGCGKWLWSWQLTGHYLQSASAVNAIKGSFSCSLWIKLRQPTGSENIVEIFGQNNEYGQANGSLDTSFKFFISSNIYFKTSGDDGVTSDLSGGSMSLILNKWSHLCGTYDSSNKDKRFYINGVLVGNGTPAHNNTLYKNTYTAGTQKFTFGRNGKDWYVPPADIQQVAIWNGTVLTTTEITQLYNNSAGLAYPFFDGKSLQFRS